VRGALASSRCGIAAFWLAKPLAASARQSQSADLLRRRGRGFCVFAGVPIAFAFGLAIFGYLALTTHTPLMVLVGRMDEGMSHLILLRCRCSSSSAC
jgi:hypothetical protein